MSRVRVAAFSVSADGFGAGPDQSLENPLGVGGMQVHQWAFGTRTFQTMHGAGGGETGVDDDFAAAGFAGVGAWILGRNMFAPSRGAWPPGGVAGGAGRAPGAAASARRRGGGAARRAGGGGGAAPRRTTRRSSCSPITRVRRSRWKAARPSIS